MRAKVAINVSSPILGPVFWENYGLTNVNSGIYQYGLELHSALSELMISPTIISERKLNWPNTSVLPLKTYALPKHPRSHKPISPLLSYSTLMQYLRTAESAAKHCVFHGLSNINLPVIALRKRRRVKFVITVHDLIPLIAVDGVSTLQRLQTSLLLPRVLHAADRVIAISDWTKNELIARYPFAKDKITLIRNGVPSFEPMHHAQKKSGIVHTLTVSRSESYKRIDFLGGILRRSSENLIATLVTDVKGIAFMTARFPDLLEQGSLRLLTNLSKPDLKSLYQACDIYVHPSLYEGFCLPAAEALSHGLPVVYCAGSGIDELFNPMIAKALPLGASTDEWLDAVHSMARVSSSPGWLETIKAAHHQLGSWKDCAKAVKSIYDSLL